jgi:hypothetical protein
LILPFSRGSDTTLSFLAHCILCLTFESERYRDERLAKVDVRLSLTSLSLRHAKVTKRASCQYKQHTTQLGTRTPRNGNSILAPEAPRNSRILARVSTHSHRGVEGSMTEGGGADAPHISVAAGVSRLSLSLSLAEGCVASRLTFYVAG